MLNLPGTNRDTLMRKAYATDEQLAVRLRIHEMYTIPKINFNAWVLDRIKWRGNERVLDVGAGGGGYFDEIRVRIPQGELIAGDLSLGMARKARTHTQAGKLVNLDAQALPFASGSMDVILANHMLFHVPDVQRALREFRRVLKPTGVLLAATNSQYSMPQLDQLVRRAYGLLGARNVDAEPKVYQFYLEDGPMKAARVFRAVARYDLPSAFVFPSAQPVIEYMDSMRTLREARLPRGISWEDFLNTLADQTQRVINHFGELVVEKLSGVVVATDGGDFARDYVSRLSNSPKP